MITRLTILFIFLSVITSAQTPYSHPVITVSNPHYITAFSQATNIDTNVVKSSTTLTAQYVKKNGTSAKHIVIINEGGPVIMTGGMEIDDCSYIDIIGWGSSDAFGFQFLNGNSSGVPVHIVGKSSNITLKGYKVIGGNSGGIWAKTEVSEVSSRYNCDASYLTTPMTNITLSCNWVENCGGEAFYIGSTGWVGDRPMTCAGVTTYPVPQKVGYIHCDSNIIINPGRTGAQMSGSITNSDNYGTLIGNKTYNTGRELNSQQGVGLSIGGSFRNPTITGNEVHTSYNYNYYITGYGNTIFSNNTGDSSGYWKNTKNPEEIPGSVFGTSINPVSWKICNNSEGYNSSQPSTGYALYTSAKNADTGNIIGGNTGNLVIFGSLIYSNNCSTPSNTPPIVNAGNDVSITSPATTVNLSGTASDPGGSIASTLWTNTDGCSITSATSLTTTATCTILGAHVFTLAATDNLGATTQDQMIATVNAASNTPPIAHAQNDTTIYLPKDSLILNQSASDPGGSIIDKFSYVIQSYYGARLSRVNSFFPALKKLVAGDTILIVFRVTDNDSAYGYDTTTVIVLDTSNHAPTARINRDTSTNTIAPTGQISIDGSSSSDIDNGDYIAAYVWTQTAGGPVTMTGDSSSVLTLDSMSPGIYAFRLTVTDSHGLTAYINFTITVEMVLKYKITKGKSQ